MKDGKIEYLKVKNWEQFQHYSRRNPPWIRLYNSLLDNAEFFDLDDASRGHLVLIWLLASRTDNKIPNNPTFIQRRINSNGRLNLNLLIEKGFLVVASSTLARRKQSATPEQRQSRAETEKDPPNPQGGLCVFVLPEWVPKEPWESFLEMRKANRKAVKTEHSKKLLISTLEKLRAQGHDPSEVLNQSTMNGWAGLFEIKRGNNRHKAEAPALPEKEEKPRTREQVWEDWKLMAKAYMPGGVNRSEGIPGLQKRMRIELGEYPQWLQDAVKKYLTEAEQGV